MNTQTNENMAWRITKIAVKVLGRTLVFGTIIFFLWRVFSSGDPKDLVRLTPNDALHAAFLAAEERGEELIVYTQKQEDYITGVPDKNYGYFGVTDAKFIPEANQVQLLFRYNNSTIRHLKEDYSLPALPDRDEDLYDVTLYIIYDLTPDNPDDNSVEYPNAIKAVRYHATSSTQGKKNLYNYRKLVFEGVDLSTPMLVVYADFYYVGDLDYGKEAYGTLPLYFHNLDWNDYELSKADRKALEHYGDEQEKP